MPSEPTNARSSDEALDSTIQSVVTSIGQAVQGLMEVEVRTIVGDASLAAWASKPGTGEDGADAIEVPVGTKGAFTRCNMATGDIVICFSDSVVDPGQIKTLHDEAVKLGTETFKANVDVLKNLLLALIQGRQSGAG